MGESAEITHKRLSSVRSNNTKPEIIVRKLLHANGFRFRINRKDLPGKPDIVLPKYNTVIFVHGCFWHRHEGCKYKSIPKKNKAFWNAKFKANVKRDIEVISQLERIGWKHYTVWECGLNTNEDADNFLGTFKSFIKQT
jgi:DNA mismatch endonuclease (patch repair protein)|tara:strand:- start:291 stop:707 length:417 start_codon:yes stop_codon:yes gene_type:complete